MSCKGHHLAGYETVTVLVAQRTQRWSVEQRCQIKCGQGIEDDDLMGGIRIDGLVQWEVCRGIIKGDV